jgi:hypothetical protein
MSTQLPPDAVAPAEDRFAAAAPVDQADQTVPVVPDPDIEPINYNPVDPDDIFRRFLSLLLGPLLRLFGIRLTPKRSHRLTIYRSTAPVPFDDSTTAATLLIPFTELVAFDPTVGDLGCELADIQTKGVPAVGSDSDPATSRYFITATVLDPGDPLGRKFRHRLAKNNQASPVPGHKAIDQSHVTPSKWRKLIVQGLVDSKTNTIVTRSYVWRKIDSDPSGPPDLFLQQKIK